MLKISATWINARIDTSDHELSQSFKNTGGLASGLTGIKIALMNCLFLLDKAEYTRILIVPTDENRKDWDRKNVGTLHRN